MQEQPLVSVLMTAYNREQYIGEAIQSVLNATYQNFELIIVDDGSRDKTVEIANRFADSDKRIKVFLNEKNLGDYPNRNKAASYAAGKYIKYVDSDDILYPHCLNVMVAGMEKYPDAGLGLCSVGDSNHPYPFKLSPYESYIGHFSGQGFFDRAPGSSIILKKAFDAVGGFTGIRQIGDYELWLKLACYYPLVKLPLDLYWSRVHADSESNVNNGLEKHQLKLKVVKKIFAEEAVPVGIIERKKIIASFNDSFIKKILRKIRN